MDQYAAYEPVKGYHVNGELTLGENIADNSGLAIAYKAYKLSLEGKEAPVIDGLTGFQRFYLGFGQVWRGKTRENAAIVRIKTDPHSPPQVRADATVKNQPGFYDAFGVKEGDKMRDDALVVLLKTNPHAPGAVRANGTVKNQPGFYDAFGVKPGDAMYLAPEQRVIMW